MSDGHGHPEIVIIHRGGHGDHDEHHGGVWKIAFADFMTAMMAFFLVLWLVSANDKTKASVARYFNPVKLVDATTQPRGLSDPKPDDPGNSSQAKTTSQTAGKDAKTPEAPKGESPKGKEARLDSELRDNPYVALAEIVGDKGPGEPSSKDPTSAKPAIGHSGAAFRDPFAPPPPGVVDVDDDTLPGDLPPKPIPTKQEAKPKGDGNTAGDAAKTDAAAKAQTDELKSAIVAATKGLAAGSKGPAIDVKTTGEGTLVSLTDTANYTMFTNGSAVPDKRVVLMMEKIAELVKQKHGQVIIRGYTDNKKFKSGRYDNWRLSLDRAQVAHYMLVRGGLDEDRISHVEGYADHDTRAGIDPADPRNRRIELLLKNDPR